MKTAIGILVALFILSVFMFFAIKKSSEECFAKGGTPIQTYSGTTCIKGVIK